MRYKNGFTLLELLIVFIIVAILAGVAIPVYLKTVEKAKAQEAVNNLRLIHLEEKRYYTRNNEFSYDEVPGDSKGIDRLPIDNPNDNPGRNFNYSVYPYNVDSPNFEAKAERRPNAGLPYRNHEYTVHKNGIVEGPLI